MSVPRPPWLRFVFALLTGVIWALAFPRAGIAGFAWLVPGLLLAVTSGAPEGLAFRTAYVAGLTHHLISLSWLRFIPFPAGAYAGWFSLSLFLALLPGLWVVACWRMARRLGFGIAPAKELIPWTTVADRFMALPWSRLNVWFLVCAASWVAWEMFITRFCGGFPWNLLGVSQYRMIPLIQIASATGVYGVSFLVAWFSVSLLTALLFLARDPDRPALWRRPLVFPALIVVATAAGGFAAVSTDAPQPRRLKVALVQPSIPQTVIFDPDATTNRFETLYRLTDQALAAQPDLILWPEASLPGGLSEEDFERLRRRLREAKVWMILGSDDIEEEAAGEPVGEPRGESSSRAYNAAFLINPEGRLAAKYHKRRLVIFGEFIPLRRWFPFLQRLAPIGDGFHPGARPVPFHMESLGITTSPLICFEDNFPQEARDHARALLDFLVNLTNNAWFGESSAQWQHAANSVFRTIETGLPLVRCCNNGLSCWIDSRGRLHSARLAEGRDIYAAGFEIVSVAFGNRRSTFFQRFGDVFGWFCVAATVAFLIPLPPPLTRSKSRP
ncbi:MAG: apolipoprotein N-acyltransferase [Limisphaerales bacterium]